MASDDKHSVPVVRLELKHVGLQEWVQMDELLRESALLKAAGAESKRLVEKASPRRLAAGQVFFQQGEKTNSLFLVLRGEVTLGHAASVVATVHKGDFFGEAEVLSPQSPRGCTATAATAADVAEFPHAEVASAIEEEVALLALLRDARDHRAKANTELDDFLNRW